MAFNAARIPAFVFFQSRNSLLFPTRLIEPVQLGLVQSPVFVLLHYRALHGDSRIPDVFHGAYLLHLVVPGLRQRDIVVHPLHPYLPLRHGFPVACSHGDHHRDQEGRQHDGEDDQNVAFHISPVGGPCYLTGHLSVLDFKHGCSHLRRSSRLQGV